MEKYNPELETKTETTEKTNEKIPKSESGKSAKSVISKGDMAFIALGAALMTMPGGQIPGAVAMGLAGADMIYKTAKEYYLHGGGKEKLDAFVGAIKEFGSKIASGLSSVKAWGEDKINSAKEGLKNIQDGIGKLSENIKQSVSDKIDSAKKWKEEKIADVKEALTGKIEKLQQSIFLNFLQTQMY